MTSGAERGGNGAVKDTRKIPKLGLFLVSKDRYSDTIWRLPGGWWQIRAGGCKIARVVAKEQNGSFLLINLPHFLT